MPNINVLFSYPTDIIGRVIDLAEGRGPDPCHSGIFILGGLCQALKQGFVKSPPDVYEGARHAVMTVVIKDMTAAETKAQELLGTPYGYIDCVNGGIHDILGKVIPGDGEITVNCSEAVIRILRAGGTDPLEGVPADCVTPADLFKALNSSQFFVQLCLK